jgi:hypothetical protein
MVGTKFFIASFAGKNCENCYFFHTLCEIIQFSWIQIICIVQYRWHLSWHNLSYIFIYCLNVSPSIVSGLLYIISVFRRYLESCYLHVYLYSILIVFLVPRYLFPKGY